MKLGSETGSMSNYLMSGTKGAPEPVVGMGCTVLMWSDRKPGTIIEVHRFKTGARAGQVRAVVIQEDKATRTDNNGMSEAQDYTYTPNPNAARVTYHANNAGVLKGPCGQLRVGERDKYHDYSF